MKYTYTAACVSDDELYRYTLERYWVNGGNKILAWLMLNPSTADADTDDATIRRCVGFSKSWGYHGMVVINLFGYRATDPRALWGDAVQDPIGVGNERAIKSVGRRCRDVVCAWGIHAPLPRARFVTDYLRDEIGCNLFCLGRTKAGAPRHPVRLASATPLVPY